MKKICFLLAVLLLLTGCGKEVLSTPTTTPASHPTEALIPTEEPAFPLVSFDIYAINDLHGRLLESGLQPGVGKLSTYLEQAQSNGNTILLANGDMWHGTSEGALTDGLMVTDWMNEMDFAAMTLGGHEYEWGEEQLRKNRELAQFPFLGINIYSRATDQQADYCQSSRVIEIEGVQIGIIGAIGNPEGAIAAEHLTNVYFKTGDELTALVKAECEKLRSEGVDFIIYLLHDGTTKTTDDVYSQLVEERELPCNYDLELSDGYVDVVFEADSHYRYVLRDPHGVLHLQAGSNSEGISHVQVLFDKYTGQAQILDAELLSTRSRFSSLEEHPVVAELTEKYAQQLTPLIRSVGHNRYYRSGDDLCRLVAELYCTTGMEKWGTQYDIVLAGGYITCRYPGYLPEGDVRYNDLQSLFPFDNQIVLCSIQGWDLVSKFLKTYDTNYHIHTTAYGDSVWDNLNYDATYYVITDTYTANYAPNNMTTLAVYDQTTFARDLLAEFITNGGFR